MHKIRFSVIEFPPEGQHPFPFFCVVDFLGDRLYRKFHFDPNNTNEKKNAQIHAGIYAEGFRDGWDDGKAAMAGMF